VRRPLLAAAFCGTLLACTALAAPALAAGGGAPKVRVTADQITQENAVATLDVRYRCATGTTATLFVSLWQGGTAENPVSLFDTSGSSTVRPLVCDGDKHLAYVTVIAVGATDDDEDGDYAFLTDTEFGGGRANVTATLTDTATGVSDTDVDRVDVVSR